ncbi:MAG: P-II family nitrogen regulator [Candidatus Marinimicrobia bacterium]|nr:P-II family nitrogen regulator [Candidatus Neomarinimicrobiota bacterium]
MNEVKAFIRHDKAESVIDALAEIGVMKLSASNVKGIGRSIAPESESRYSVNLTQKYSKVTKLEIVCRSSDTEQIVDALRKGAYSGQQGDGMIYVVPVETALKIRTGATGKDAL